MSSFFLALDTRWDFSLTKDSVPTGFRMDSTFFIRTSLCSNTNFFIKCPKNVDNVSHPNKSPWFRQEVVPPIMAKTKKHRCVPLAILCELLVLCVASAQLSIAQANLHIVVVEGEGAKNAAQQIAAKELIVRVLDGNNRPVEGAAVTFIAPASGPSGDFTNDSKSIRVLANTDGVANAGPYHPNAATGAYEIQIRAEFRRALATATVSQMNVVQGKRHKKMITIIAIAGAAAGAAIVARAATSPSSSSSSGIPTITFGGSGISVPK